MAARYSATWEETAGVPIAVLRDAETQAEARVAPSLGNTCIAFRFGDWQILDEPPNDQELLTRASSYGIPILFPWPNRLRDARFTWEGREYHIPPSPGTPHANHGLVRNRPWNVVCCEASDGSAAVQSEIVSTAFPELAEQYPGDFRLSVTYRLESGELAIDAVVTNIGTESLPFGYGLHPYFVVPLSPNERRESCRLHLPATERWELVDQLPTGRRLPVSGRFELSPFRRLDSETYDDVFTGLVPVDDREVGRADGLPLQYGINNTPQDDREILVGADAAFREAVLFTPPHRSIVALEPYTWAVSTGHCTTCAQATPA